MNKILNRESSFIATVMWIGFIWLHTFMRVVRFPNSVGTMDFLRNALLTLGLTFFWFWCLLDHRTGFLDELWGSRYLLNFSMIIIALMSALLMLSVSLETWSYDFSYGIEIAFLQITVGCKLNLGMSWCSHTQNVIGLAYRYLLRFSVFTLS